MRGPAVGSISRGVDIADDLTPLDPAYRSYLRARALIRAAALLLAAVVAEAFSPWPTGTALIPALLIGAVMVVILPQRRFARWHYALGDDRLRVQHGAIFRTDTMVPLGRVQHVDIDQGPLMRHWDLSALSLHTAGSHGETVTIPGLRRADAEAIRERIRDHIRQAQE